jgi:hypothetical protein
MKVLLKPIMYSIAAMVCGLLILACSFRHYLRAEAHGILAAPGFRITRGVRWRGDPGGWPFLASARHISSSCRNRSEHPEPASLSRRCGS